MLCEEAAPMHVDENSPYVDSTHDTLPLPPPLASESGTSSCCRSESTAATSATLETALNLYSPGLAGHLSVESFAARPHLSTEYSSTSSVSQADTEIIDICSPDKTVSGSPAPKTEPSEPLLPTAPSATEFLAPPAPLIKPRPIAHTSSSLSRSSSVNKHVPGISHTPKPILPRPTSAASSSTHNVSVIQTKNGAKHQLVLPTSSRTMQVEKSVQRRASGRKVGTHSSGGPGQNSGTATGTATPFNLLGNIPPLAGPNGVLSATIPPSGAPAPSEYHQPDSPFNNHAFDLLPVVPVRSDPLDDIGSFSAAEASEDDGIWDLVDDGERWILPSAPPPDDLLAGFDIPEGSWLADGSAASNLTMEDGADLTRPRT
ncbi:hypothetical protein QFC22_001621 [Naganishia vaughanmartiniae]|uniref:Uncharacterized protein n=1 Tax=Naganishia vaughanmartiniae TaxID=1424756 RepID=A0ACC2XJ59_9TREE|nr:hypothetical protein QFC22_001621 [Naganishia vaughanmartiniae]